jgi:pilus assembly protein Flp/PilA
MRPASWGTPKKGATPLAKTLKEPVVDLVAYFRTVVAPWVRARVNVKSELGASLVEYALLVALIAVVAIIAIRFLGQSASSKFSSVGSAIS